MTSTSAQLEYGRSGESRVSVSYCLVTSGEAGGDDLPLNQDELAALRQEEQTAAALAVGVQDLHC